MKHNRCPLGNRLSHLRHFAGGEIGNPLTAVRFYRTNIQAFPFQDIVLLN